MTKRASFTEAEVKRVIKAARKHDQNAVVEFVTPGGTVRILPAVQETPINPFDLVDFK